MAGDPILLIVTPAGRSTNRGPLFHARHGDRLLVTSHQPFLASARTRLAEGLDPATELILRHAGSTTDALRATVSAAARLTVLEDDRGGLRFGAWNRSSDPTWKGPRSASRSPAFPAEKALQRLPAARQSAFLRGVALGQKVFTQPRRLGCEQKAPIFGNFTGDWLLAAKK